MKYQPLQFTLPETPFQWVSHLKAVWEDGTIFEAYGDGRGRIESNGIGFPVKFAGDAFHALMFGYPMPERCKGW